MAFVHRKDYPVVMFIFTFDICLFEVINLKLAFENLNLLDKRLANHSLWAKSSWKLVFENKVLLELSHTFLLSLSLRYSGRVE